MRWALSTYTAPLAEPLHVDDAKLHLGVDITEHDAAITVLIGAARRLFEEIQGRALITQTFDLTLDEWPQGREIKLPRAPLRSVTSITYVDSDGTSATFAASNYVVDTKSEPGRITLGYNKSWPSATLRPGGAITIRYVSGYATAFTAVANTDILTATGHGYANGDIVRVSNSGGSSAALPTGLSANTDYYVVGVSGSTLQLSATSGGSAIDITGAGTGTHYLGVVPRDVIAGMKLLVGHLYEHREAVVVGSIITALPFGLNSMLELDRLHYVGPGD